MVMNYAFLCGLKDDVKIKLLKQITLHDFGQYPKEMFFTFPQPQIRS